VDSAWEQKKLKATLREMLENAADSHTSGACYVGTLLTLRLTCQFENTLLDFNRNPHTRIT